MLASILASTCCRLGSASYQSTISRAPWLNGMTAVKSGTSRRTFELSKIIE